MARYEASSKSGDSKDTPPQQARDSGKESIRDAERR